MAKKSKATKKEVELLYGVRSGLEEDVTEQLTKLGAKYEYEPYKISFIQPEKKRTYTPDFVLANGIVIETKGRFLTADRQKHEWIQELYPNMDLRFVFTNPNARISKTSKTTYAMWCEKRGFKYASKLIPGDWIDE